MIKKAWAVWKRGIKERQYHFQLDDVLKDAPHGFNAGFESGNGTMTLSLM